MTHFTLYGHKAFEYEFRTRKPKLSNQNSLWIKDNFLIGCFFDYAYKYRTGNFTNISRGLFFCLLNMFNILTNHMSQLLRLFIYTITMVERSFVRSFPHSWLIIVFVNKNSTTVVVLKQELLTRPGHLYSHHCILWGSCWSVFSFLCSVL